MKQLVDDLAKMCALRDRSALNVAIVQLVAQHFPAVRSAWLLRIVVDGKDRRCLSCAMHGVQNIHPERDSYWADWSVLPSLNEFPLRHQAINHVRITSAYAQDGCTYTTVFPMNKPLGYNAVLELGSAQPLDAATTSMLLSILAHYQNLIGLLDYGERDTLTELLNRKTFDHAFMKATTSQHTYLTHKETERRIPAMQGGYWLAILDIDHFKRVNDTYGHLIGDEVLLLLARLMRANFRFHDQLYRFGGEEFVVLMRCINQNDAYTALERLRQSVQAFMFPQAGQITISVGFTALVEHDTPGNAFGRADKAVYYAKGNGRNLVCNYQNLVDQGHLNANTVEEMEVDLF